jgi:hypothetical protein
VLTVNDQLTSIQTLGSGPRDVSTQVIYDAYTSFTFILLAYRLIIIIIIII